MEGAPQAIRQAARNPKTGGRLPLLIELFGLFLFFPLTVLAGGLPVSARWIAWLLTASWTILVCGRSRVRLQDLGLASRRSIVRALSLNAIMGLLLLAADALGWVPAGVARGVDPRLVATVYLVLSVPIQELFFRGFFFFRYESVLGSGWTTLASGLLFGFYHVIFGLSLGVVATLAAGLVLAAVFARTRRLAVCWVVHAALGLAAYLAGYAAHFTTFARTS